MSRNKTNKASLAKEEERDEVSSSNKGKSRGRSRGKGRNVSGNRRENPKTSGNDPSWYAANPIILRDAASYPFSFNTGATEIHDASVWNIADVTDKPHDQIPGIASFHVYPCVGTALAATDPVNVASQSVYSFVRHANSGSKNYDAPDLMLYILAMANMYSFLVWCQRLYGYALTYDQRNRYLPKDLIRTNNVDPVDLVNNLANFRFWINTLIAKMVSFAVPATMSIFSRMSFMYSDYYIEGTSIKDQLYQYVPEGFYEFGIDSASLGNLVWKPFDYTTIMTVQDVMTYGESLFNAIWSQEDFGIMSGDILKAYGSNIIKLSPIPEYYNVVPKFDAMVLTQMKNADLVRVDPSRISQSPTDGIILQTLVPLGYSTSDTYYYDATTLVSVIATKMNNIMVATLKDYRILTVDTDNPDPAVVIEATRLKVAYDGVKNWYKAGTELITKVTVTIEPGTDMDITALSIIVTKSDDAGQVPMAKFEEASRNFHYMPRYWKIIQRGGVNTFIVNQSFDIDNFTLLTYEDVKKLHEAATINMFAVPSVGSIQ